MPEDCDCNHCQLAKAQDANFFQITDAKPDEARDRIVRLYGDVPRLEMFARRDPTDMHIPRWVVHDRHSGWSIWGNEAALTVAAHPATFTDEERGSRIKPWTQGGDVHLSQK